MSDADTNRGGSDPEMTSINLRLSEAFLNDIDASWREEGFNSRSEFMRYALRDAVKHPGLLVRHGNRSLRQNTNCGRATPNSFRARK